MSYQTWVETPVAATSTATAIANSTTETVLVGNQTVTANFMQGVRALRMTAYGSYGTTGTPTLIFTLRYGGVSGTVIAKSSTVTTTSGVGGGASMTALWSLDAIIQCRSNGASGTLMSNGLITLHTSTAITAGTVTNYGQPVPLVSGTTGGTTPVVATVDLTIDQPLSLTATWGTANAANSIQTLQYYLEVLN